MLLYAVDLKLRSRHSTRHHRDCVTLGREDFTIQTALLETPVFIAADTPRLAQNLTETLKTRSVAAPAAAYIEAKLEEARRGWHRQAGLRMSFEPNFKEAKGACADLQSLFWIAKHTIASKKRRRSRRPRRISV